MLYVANPLTIVDVPADDNHMADGRIAFDFIVLHDTGGVNSRKWLSTTSNPRVSAHRLIERDGTIVKIVSDAKIAYTQGFSSIEGYPSNERFTGDLNRVSLSIEFERLRTQQYTHVQLLSGAKQCVEWIGLYDSPSILYHWQIDEVKDDPYLFPRSTFMRLIYLEMKQYL